MAFAGWRNLAAAAAASDQNPEKQMEDRVLKSQDRQRIKQVIIFVAAATAAVCVVATIFFRMDVIAALFKGLVSVLKPFIYGLVIAYLLHPVALKLESFFTKLLDRNGTGKRKSLARMIAIALSIILFLLCLVLLIMAVLPEIIRSLSSIVSQIPGALESFKNWMNTLDQSNLSHEVVTTIQQAMDTLSTYVSNFLKDGLVPKLQDILSGMTTSIKGILGVFSNFGLGCIISIYFLSGWEKFLRQIKLITYAIFPKRAADWLKAEAKIVDQMFSGFVYGKILDSILMGVICFIYTTITQTPYNLLVSVLIGVTNMIPFFGPYIGGIPSAIIILTVSPSKCVMFVIFLIILMQVDGNIISPRILGNKLGLSGFWILFSILVFGSLWGIVGMLIGTPLFAVLYDLIRRGVYYLLKKKGLSRL